tara:strand:+ start:507 stop:1691 length:1185 start_codon:yes stop_codon:yes gene_type:complete
MLNKKYRQQLRMADPVSIAAIAGLAYLGKRLSEQPEKTTPPVTESIQPIQDMVAPAIMDNSSTRTPQRKLEHPTFGDIAPQYRTSGSEVLEMRDRMFDTGRMNNLSPVEKQLVGPGLGVGAEVPAFGGHQQLFRVNPENVGAYRLTTLPGRSGPAHDISGGRRGVMGEIGNNRPETTAMLTGRRPPVGGRAQGMSGVVVRSEHEHTKRPTNRSETGSRTDGLGFRGAKRLVSELTSSQDPTRNKKDGNIEQYAYNNNPAPNIHKYAHGYLTSPASKIGEKRTYAAPHTVEELQKYGFRPDDRRGKANRAGNAGRMNVRAGPLNQGGLPTAARTDTTRIDGRVNGVNGGWTQQYTNDSYHQLNTYKGNQNPLASGASLNIAKNQMQKNPLSQQYF